MDYDEDVSRSGTGDIQNEKKRPRRVSFSDITSVHFFDRDEDYETPPDNKPSLNSIPTPHKQVNEFFGPVSLWHIASGGAQQSPMENDVTLDSTEFSQQFSKLLLAQRENFRQMESTPTGESADASPENFMTLTGNVPQPNPQSVSIEASTDKDNTGDMSLTGENPSEYNFASLSPNLATLMTDKALQIDSNVSVSRGSSCNIATPSETDKFVKKGNDGPKPKNPLLESDTQEGTWADGNTKASGVSLIPSGEFASDSLPGKSGELNYWDIIDLSNEHDTSKETNDEHDLLNFVSSSKPFCNENHKGHISNSMDGLYTDCKDHMNFVDRPASILKDKSISPSIHVEVRNQDEGPSLQRDIWEDKNFDCAHKLPDTTGPVQNYSELIVAPNASSPASDGNICLVRPILAPISPNSEGKRPSNTFSKIRTPGQACKYKGLAAGSNILKHDHQNKEFIRGQSLKEFASEQPLVSFFTMDENSSVCKPYPSKHSIKYKSKAQMEEMDRVEVQNTSKMKTESVNELLPPSPLITNFSCEQMEQQKSLGHLSHHQDTMITQEVVRDLSHKTHVARYTPQRGFSLLQAESKGNHGKGNRCEILQANHGTSLINISENSGITHQNELEECVVKMDLPLDCIPESSVLSTEKHSLAKATLNVQKYTKGTSKKQIEVPRKFSVGVNELCLPPIAKPRTLKQCLRFMYATRPEVCLLEDTVKKLQTDISNLKTLSNPKNQIMDGKSAYEATKKPVLLEHFRMGHIKWLQQILAYAKSKSELMLAKKDELKKLVQNIQLGCQEVDKLKSMLTCLDKMTPLRQKNDCSIQEHATSGGKNSHIQSLEVDIEKQLKLIANKKIDLEAKLKEVQMENVDTCEKLIIMNQELNGLDNKIRDLCEFYCGVCTENGNVPKKEVLQSIESSVKNMAKNSVILQDMVLWKLKDIRSQSGEHFIELNYLDLVSQRFNIEGNVLFSKVSASYNLSYQTVEKVFPFMNASTAVDAVFASKKSFNTIDAGAIWQTVQEMSFLFGTLIDVLQEIQLCRTKLRNLSFARFHCFNGSQLHLQLTFLKYTCGLKIVLILDMEDLKCGIYPCDVIPLQVELTQHGQQSQGLLAAPEIEESVRSLTSGYSRLRMLCDCISKLIECKK